MSNVVAHLVLARDGNVFTGHERLELGLFQTQVTLDFRRDEHEPVVDGRQPELSLHVVRECPDVLGLVELFQDLRLTT